MKKKIKVAIIGYGVVGKRRKNFIIQNKKYSLEAISDITFTKKKFRSKKIIYYKNYYELLSEASKISLKMQGGIMTNDEAKKFESNEFFENAIIF